MKKDENIAMLLNVLWPGAGDIYIGNTDLGVKYVIGYFILLALGFFLFVPWIGCLIVWILRIVGVRKDCMEMNAKIEEEEKKQVRREQVLAAKREEAKRNTVTAASLKNGLLSIEKLRRAGILAEEEFQRRKTDLIQSVAQKTLGQDADSLVLELIPLTKNGILSDAELKQIHQVAELGDVTSS